MQHILELLLQYLIKIFRGEYSSGTDEAVILRKYWNILSQNVTKMLIFGRNENSQNSCSRTICTPAVYLLLQNYYTTALDCPVLVYTQMTLLSGKVFFILVLVESVK